MARLGKEISVFKNHEMKPKYGARFSAQLLLIRKTNRSGENPDAVLKTAAASLSESSRRIKQTAKNQLKKKETRGPSS